VIQSVDLPEPHVTDGLCLVDATGRLAYADERFCELVGANASVLIGRPVETILPRDVAVPGDPVSALLLAHELEWSTLLRGDLPATVRAIPVARADGRPLAALLAITSGVTCPSNEPVPAAPTTAAMFEAAFQEGDRARMLITGRDHTVIGVNAACATLFALPARDILGCPVAAVPVWRSPSEVASLCERAVSTGAPAGSSVSMHVEGTRATGPSRVDLTVSPLASISAAVVSVEDSRESGRLLEIGGRAHRLEELGRLAGGIAHDFNNLLTVVHAYAQIIGAAVSNGGDVARADVDEIVLAVDRGRQLSGHLLAFARNRPVDRRLVDVNASLRGLSGMLRPLLGAKVALGFYLAPNLPPILADPVQLDQVMLNLAINACAAMSGGGHLSVATRHVRIKQDDLPSDETVPLPGEYVVIEVADTGHGMDRETQDHIFDAFFTTRAEVAGTGLGLSVVSGILSQAGGRVVVRSIVKRGTTFRVFWPCATPIDEQAVPVTSRSPSTDCVMVIADDASVRQLIRRLLAEAGFDSAQARDTGIGADTRTRRRRRRRDGGCRARDETCGATA
jgi:signal transduction histidine kinase